MKAEVRYEGLAAVYDRLLSGVDYEEWTDYVLDLTRGFDLSPTSVLDLACGTGSSTLPWAIRAFSPVMGIDLSGEMINVARQKARLAGLPVNFYCQDMRNFQVEQSFDLCIIYQDGLNYLLSIDDFKKTLSRVKKHLNPHGLFVFDLNMIDKLPVSSTSQLCWADEDDMTLIWETCYDENKKIWEIELTAFLKGKEGYQKFKEKHRERTYETGEIISALDRSSWKILGFYEAFTRKTPSADCRHVVFVTRPGGDQA